MPPLSKLQDLIGRAFNVVSQALDVLVKDETTIPIDFYFVKINQSPPTTLANAITTVDPTTFVYDIDITEATGFAVGDYVGIFKDSTIERFYFGEIKAITGSSGPQTVTLDTPLDFNFPAGSTAASFDRNMNVDGSSTPLIYQIEIGGGSNKTIHLNRIMFQMKTSISTTLGLFGDLARLPLGIVLRKVDENGFIQNQWTVKDNAQLSLLAFDLKFYTASGQGQEGLGTRKTNNGKDRNGVSIELKPTEKLQLVIQDDLNTAQSSAQITEFFMMAQGHFTD